MRGRSISKPQYMFPRITRADADKNILSAVKYILNYGFYRFGIEVRFFFFKLFSYKKFKARIHLIITVLLGPQVPANYLS